MDQSTLKNRWGTVRPYTRHQRDCKHRKKLSYNQCACSKWIYENPKSGEARRSSLVTPSWAEAMQLAMDKLKGFEPEVKKARQAEVTKERQTKTVLEGIDLWLDRTRSLFGKDAAIVSQYRSTFGWIDADGIAHGMLLKFVEKYNREHSEARIINIDEMTPLVCQQWNFSKEYSELSPVTRKQRWGTVRSFFKFLHELGVIPVNPAITIKAAKASENYANTPLSPEEFNRLLTEADWYVDERVRNGERDVHCRRMRALLLLRHTGMDLKDACLFRPDWIRYADVDDELVPVLRYRRCKTRVEAVIPLPPEIAETLKTVPLAPQGVPEMPFRYRENDIRSDVHNWGRRIHRLYTLAKLEEVQLVGKDGRPAVDDMGNPSTKRPNTKMLRHTFAVGCLTAGMREESVAKMLGHVGTDMIRQHYGPWCKERDEAHVREVREALKPKKSAPNNKSRPASRGRAALTLQ